MSTRPGDGPTTVGLPRQMFAVAAALVATVVTATLIVDCLTGRPPWDDEGYVLISLRGAVGGHALYDEVYSQYGPAFFALVGSVFGVLRLPLTMDAARIATALMWLVTAALMGVSVARVTRSKEAGLLVGALTAIWSPASLEAPLHPTHLLCLLAAIALLGVVALEQRGVSVGRAAMVGVPIALALLTKVNVGVFLAAAVAYGLARPRQRLFSVARSAIVVAVPGALAAASALGGHSSSLVWSLTCAAGVFALGARQRRARAGSLVRGAVSMTTITGVAVLGDLLLRGTSLGGFVGGLVLDPLRLVESYQNHMRVGEQTFFVLGGVALIALAARNVDSVAFALVVAAGGGAVLLLAAYEQYEQYLKPTEIFADRGVNSLVVGAGLAWIVTRAGPEFRSSRLALAAAGVLFPLQAYPVAGGQRVAGAMFFPALGVIALMDAIRLSPGRARTAMNSRAAVRVAPFVFFAAAVVMSVFALGSAQTEWEGTTAIGLPGATLTRTIQSDATDVHLVTEALRSCPTFYSLPGLNSFYLFTETAPPTWHNATTWMSLFDEQLQQEVVEDLRTFESFCVLRHPDIERLWLGSEAGKSGPLRPYLDAGVQLVGTYGGYSIYRHSNVVL